MQALQRLAQKSIQMEIKIHPLSIYLRGIAGELNEGQSCELQVQIVRGPYTFTSKAYHVTPEAEEVMLSSEEFKKNSGFYFTQKEGAQHKKAVINIVKKSMVNGKEKLDILTTTDINLASLISKEMKDSRLDIGKNGILAL